MGKNHEFLLEGGPAAQFVNESQSTMRFELGGHARLAYVLYLRESVYWSLDTSFTRIGDIYTRAEATTSLVFEF